MHLNVAQLVVWIVIGALAGTLAGKIMRHEKDFWANLIIGLIGALLGGFLFDFFKIHLGLGNLNISFDQLLAAFVGSILFIFLLAFIKK
jgi:uncharacterized membrane protein YeaQ/YmgE (transglycosylase-associated protein family)